jgi:hypothetical protein
VLSLHIRFTIIQQEAETHLPQAAKQLELQLLHQLFAPIITASLQKASRQAQQTFY